MWRIWDHEASAWADRSTTRLNFSPSKRLPRLREFSERGLAVTEEEADFVLHIPAHVARVPEVLRLQDVWARDLLDPALERVDLRVHDREVEDAQEVHDVPRDEHVRDRLPALVRGREVRVVLPQEVLLEGPAGALGVGLLPLCQGDR